MFDFITIDESLHAISRDWRITGHDRINTDDGRLYARLTTTSGTTTIELFNRPERMPADLVASGSGTIGTVTLAQANSSGLSGSVELIAQPSFDATLIVFYATDEDLDVYEENLASLLDTGGMYAGEPGFERYAALAKRRLDDMIVARIHREGLRGLSREHILSSLLDLPALTEPASYLALALLFERLAGAPDVKAADRSRYFYRRFEQSIASARLVFDFTGTGSAAFTLLFGDVTLLRG
ncbi:MAG: hypothetical protein L6Q71_06180 [Planctomycetes bacterium]|nr:hypothetical protein [Planctomycetota bacterium]NUQ35052.1 hypothetical protein [Planctomycetaceae bacterium]